MLTSTISPQESGIVALWRLYSAILLGYNRGGQMRDMGADVLEILGSYIKATGRFTCSLPVPEHKVACTV